MCTIVVIHGLHGAFPTVVAANRDEFHARPTAAPELVRHDPRVLAGRDLDKGGTWMGATDAGTFVALTNQRSWSAPDPAARSRGEVAMTLLGAGTVGAMLEVLRGLDARSYNAFNLMLGDADRVFVAYGRPDRGAVEVHALRAGVHVLVNDRMGSPEFPKSDRARSLVEPHTHAPWPALLDVLTGMLGDHHKPPIDSLPDPPAEAAWPKEGLVELQALCTHAGPYGTRSSSIVALRSHETVHYLHAEGAPCETPFDDLSALLR
jgi:uncharacterized protein with NRDE domain